MATVSGRALREAALSPSATEPDVSALPGNDQPRVLHIKNGRAVSHTRTFGNGVTWCGKKLLGKPTGDIGDVETFSSYGSDVHVTLNPSCGTCQACQERFDAAYAEAFPDGLKPIATFRADDEESMRRAKSLLSPDALRAFFAPGDGGLGALEQAFRDSDASLAEDPQGLSGEAVAARAEGIAQGDPQ